MWGLRIWTERLAAICIAVMVICFSGCGRSPESRIERVLNRCAKISQQASGYRDPAAQAAYVAREFQDVDVSGCPPAFRVAFQEHVNAWSQAQMAFGQNTVAAGIMEGFVAGLADDYSGFGASQRRAAAAHQEINATYYRLTAIAAEYGARVPHSAVE